VNPALKAVVLKTARLKETMAFFVDQLGFVIEESSITHFVIHSGSIRILFVESVDGMGVEFYLSRHSAMGLRVQEDPNHIKIIITQK
jgi:hypothetical protein